VKEELTRIIDEIKIHPDYSKEGKPRFCFVVFSSREDHIGIPIDCIETVIKKKEHHEVKRLDDHLKSEDSQYGELTELLKTCSFAVVILDGFRPNVLFEYGILKGLGKPCIVLLEKQAKIDVLSFYTNPSPKILNPLIDMDKNFSDVKDRFYVRYDKNNPPEIRQLLTREFGKRQKDIDNEFIRMIYPNKDIILKQLKKHLNKLLKIVNKRKSQLTSNNETEFKKSITKIEQVCRDKGITLPNYYYSILAILFLRFEKNREALQLITPLIKYKKDDLVLIDIKATILIKLKRYKEAIKEYDRALKLNPKIEKLWHDEGFLLEHLRKKEEAISVYKKALKVNNKFSTIHFHYGTILYEFNKYAESLGHFEEALSISPERANYLMWKAKALFELKQKEQAVETIKKAIAVNEKNADAWFTLGKFTDDNREALKYFERALQIDPKHGSALCSKAACLSISGKYKKALDIFSGMGSFCHEYPRCTTILVNTILTMKNDKMPINRSKYLKRAVEIPEKDLGSLTNKAILYCYLGKREESLKLFKKAIKRSPKSANLWYDQACVFALNNCVEDSIWSLKKAIELDPKYFKQMLNDNDFDGIRKKALFVKAFQPYTKTYEKKT
jgi:tetratricopeptide (TPR) repeat protein